MAGEPRGQRDQVAETYHSRFCSDKFDDETPPGELPLMCRANHLHSGGSPSPGVYYANYSRIIITAKMMFPFLKAWKLLTTTGKLGQEHEYGVLRVLVQE